MLLQTNSYIVPKDRRAEHARLLRRFRQILTRLGCEQFEVYEQLGANWSTAEQTGRFVQIMRFKDRRHQRQVHAAEQSDRAAQQLIEEFCALINLSYQQQQGLLAVGYYQSVVDSPTKRPVAEAPDPFAGAAPAGAGFGMAGAAAAGVSMAAPLGMGGRSTVVPVDLDAEDANPAEAAADERGLGDEPVVAEVAEAHDTYTLVAGPEAATDAGPETATISAEVPQELRGRSALTEADLPEADSPGAEQPEAVADDSFDPDALLAEVPPVPATEPASAEPVAGELLIADEGLLEVHESAPAVGRPAAAVADAAVAHDPLTPEVEAELSAEHVATEDGLSGLPPEVVDELNFDEVSAGLEFQPDAEPAAEPVAHVVSPAVAEPPAAAAQPDDAAPVEELTALDEWPTEELVSAAELSPLEEAAPVADLSTVADSPTVDESLTVEEFTPVEGLSGLEELPPVAEATPAEEAVPAEEPLATVEADAEEPDLPDELSLAPLAADVLPTMSEEGVAPGELQPVGAVDLSPAAEQVAEPVSELASPAEAATADDGVVGHAGGDAISLDDFLLDEAPASAEAEPVAEPLATLPAEEPLPVEAA
ncbi:MAG TPA: hypothetical protein VF796_09200, partial [Humisphaera sp.]